MKNGEILYVVIPCFNEEMVIRETTKRLKEKLTTLMSKKIISKESKVMYVDDGSTDKTWDLIEEIYKKEKYFTGISLSRNRGHQNALLAGLMTAKDRADIVISMDADLQDDIDAVDKMLEKYHEGNEVVYGVRSSRKKDSWFKKTTAESFYKFMKFMGADIIFNHADYRLASKKVLNELEKYKEVKLFLRGIFPLIGFKSDIVYYKRNKRFAGESKYPLKKMLNFAWNGITSFSIKPIKLVLNVGIIMFIVSILVLIYCLVVKLTGHTVAGWTFIVCSIWIVAAIQMLAIGLIGEYIGKIYSEVKERPKYVIEKDLEKEKCCKYEI